MAAALTCGGPGLGVIDVRFAPFAQLSLALCGAAALGSALAALALPDVAALALVLLAVVHADGASRYLRSWVDWNYSGLEAKELWPAWRALNDRLRGGAGDPRVAVEYDPVHERAGSIRMYEMLPFFSGRSTLEGVYNQASTMTHPVYYLASELFARSPNPFRSRSYSRFDPQSALARVRLFDVGAIVATSRELAAALDARSDVVREARIAPYTLYRLRDPGPGYVEPLRFEPVRAPLHGWRDQCYRWFTRKPANRALLVFTDDPRFTLVQPDPWLPPPERPLPASVHVKETVEAESIRIETDRPGHPLLVKVSYHPRWRVEGGAGPYLVSPGLMLVVPTARVLRLRYAARDASDWTGIALALAAALATVAGLRLRPRGAQAGPGRPEGDSRAPGHEGAAFRVAPACARAARRRRRRPRGAAAPAPAVARARGDVAVRAGLACVRRRAVAGCRGARAARFRPRVCRPTRGGTSCCACRASRCWRPGTRARRRSRSRPSSTRAGRTGRRPCSPGRARERRPATRPAPRRGGGSSRSTTREPPGPRGSARGRRGPGRAEPGRSR